MVRRRNRSIKGMERKFGTAKCLLSVQSSDVASQARQTGAKGALASETSPTTYNARCRSGIELNAKPSSRALHFYSSLVLLQNLR